MGKEADRLGGGHRGLEMGMERIVQGNQQGGSPGKGRVHTWEEELESQRCEDTREQDKQAPRETHQKEWAMGSEVGGPGSREGGP